MLASAIKQRMAGEESDIDILKTGHTMLLLIQNKSSEVLTQLYLPQFAKIFVLAIKLDNLCQQRQWPQAFADLLSLVQNSADENAQKQFIRLIVKTLQVFDEEVVERSETKPMAELELSQRIKDAMRVEAVVPILQILMPTLQNYNVFQVKTIKGALKVLS